MSNTQKPSYAFSDKYDREHARTYFYKHQSGVWRRLSTWREIGMARKALALAGNPKTVLDLPSGTGRFWELLAEQQDRVIYAADNSPWMFQVGMEERPKAITSRIAGTYECSAFGTGFQDNFVESVFCMRLLHHIQKSEDRIAMLREFARISSDTVLVSLWVDGNYRAWRMKRKHARRHGDQYQPRDRVLLSREAVEQEFAAAGLQVVGHVDFIKYWDKWRTYVLKVVK